MSKLKQLPHQSSRYSVAKHLILLGCVFAFFCSGCKNNKSSTIPASTSKLETTIEEKSSLDKTDARTTLISPKPSSIPKELRYVYSLPERKMMALVPEQSGICFTECPNCETDTQDRAKWIWNPEHPHEIKCPGCGMTFPNKKYPDNHSLVLKSKNKNHIYPYYTRPDGYLIYFQAAADYKAMRYMAKKAMELAELYQKTKNIVFARRAMLILERFADVYPGYLCKFDYPFKQKIFLPYPKNRVPKVNEYRTSRYSWWAYMGISRKLLYAYEGIKEWEPFKSGKYKIVNEKIRKDLFADMVSFVMGFKETYNNMSPVGWLAFIHAAKALDRPEWAYEALKRINYFLDNRFLYDGHWMETSPSYCLQVFQLLDSLRNMINEYTPTNHNNEKIIHEIQRIKKKINLNIAYLKRSLYAVRRPNGGLQTINDTWSATRLTPLAQSDSILMPGLGLAVLGAGKGKSQVQATLDNTGGWGHHHRGALGITWFDTGREVFRDLGYTHTACRVWTQSTMSHNTVVVNGMESAIATKMIQNRIRYFSSDHRAFHFSEAENNAAYLTLGRYRRSLMLVGDSGENAYLIDIFQVYGGNQQDYLLHGSPDENSTINVNNVKMSPVKKGLMNPRVNFSFPTKENARIGNEAAYGFVTDLSKGKSSKTVVMDMRLSSNPHSGSRTYLNVNGPLTIFTGETPRVRQAEGHDNLLRSSLSPFFCARRKGKNLQSVFAAVHELITSSSKPWELKVKRFKKGILLIINRKTLGYDYFMMAYDEKCAIETNVNDGFLKFSGKLGFARIKNNEVIEAHILSGDYLSIGGFTLKGIPNINGKVISAIATETTKSKGYITTDKSVVGGDLKGKTLFISFPNKMWRAYTIVNSEIANKRTRINLIEKLGFEITKNRIKTTSYPKYLIKSSNLRFHVNGVNHYYGSVKIE